MLSLLLTTALAPPPNASPTARPPSAPAETTTEADVTSSEGLTPAQAYHRDRTLLGLSGMGVLTGWAIGNIAVGIAGNLTATGPTRFFFQGNAAWNTVNLALGIGGLVSQHRDRQTVVDLHTGRARARGAQTVFGINAALDIGYISTGAILWSLAERASHDRVLGYGQSLVLQGSFLLAFDVAMMLGHEWLLDHSPAPALARVRLRPVAMHSIYGTRRVFTPGLALRLHRSGR